MTEPRIHERSASLSADVSIKVGEHAGSMLGNAQRQVERGQYAAGIMLAQAAVEMAASHAFIGLVARTLGVLPVPPVQDLVPDLSFMDKRTRTLWKLLTGRSITEPKEEVWKPYHEHVERRNRVAHGQEWGDAEGGKGARESVEAARAFMERMAEDLSKP